MNLTWLGHSCFILESLGYRIIIDPFKDVKGLNDVEASVNGVYCSHGHFDHSYTEKIKTEFKIENPFKIKEVLSYHDDKQGRLRGKNTIRSFCSHGVNLVHLGDLGHELSDKQISQLGKVDVLLLPIGGTYTIDPKEAKAVAEAINPRLIIPMHYREGEKGFPELASLPEFTDLFPSELIKYYDGQSLSLCPGMEKQIAVLKMP